MPAKGIFSAITAICAAIAVAGISVCCAADASKGTWQPELRIGLSGAQKTVSFRVNRDCYLASASDAKRRIPVPKGEETVVVLSGKEFHAKGKTFSGEKLELRTTDPRDMGELVTVLGGKQYRGGLQLLQRGGGMTVVNILPAEQYLRGVLPEEMPVSWAQEALKSQAVAARTFALKNRKRHEADGYDLCSSTHCQIYTGMEEEDPHADTAIRSTYGEVLVSGGALIDAFFHTDSGGMTENSEEVWGTHFPYLRAAKEPEMKTHPWSKAVSMDAFQAKAKLGKIKSIELSRLEIGKKGKDRTSSGRVKHVRVVGKTGSKLFSGADLRSMFALKSTLFSISYNGKQVTFSGYGWGHGLGMSQWGAKAFAERGDDYRKILSHYYRNTDIKKLY